jgi:hypothetical protein
LGQDRVHAAEPAGQVGDGVDLDLRVQQPPPNGSTKTTMIKIISMGSLR